MDDRKKLKNRRSSILKPAKSLAADEFDEATQEVTEMNFDRRVSRRVSFAETCQVKEFQDPREWVDPDKDPDVVGNENVIPEFDKSGKVDLFQELIVGKILHVPLEDGIPFDGLIPEVDFNHRKPLSDMDGQLNKEEYKSSDDVEEPECENMLANELTSMDVSFWHKGNESEDDSQSQSFLDKEATWVRGNRSSLQPLGTKTSAIEDCTMGQTSAIEDCTMGQTSVIEDCTMGQTSADESLLMVLEGNLKVFDAAGEAPVVIGCRRATLPPMDNINPLSPVFLPPVTPAAPSPPLAASPPDISIGLDSSVDMGSTFSSVDSVFLPDTTGTLKYPTDVDITYSPTRRVVESMNISLNETRGTAGRRNNFEETHLTATSMVLSDSSDGSVCHEAQTEKENRYPSSVPIEYKEQDGTTVINSHYITSRNLLTKYGGTATLTEHQTSLVRHDYVDNIREDKMICDNEEMSLGNDGPTPSGTNPQERSEPMAVEGATRSKTPSSKTPIKLSGDNDRIPALSLVELLGNVEEANESPIDLPKLTPQLFVSNIKAEYRLSKSVDRAVQNTSMTSFRTPRGAVSEARSSIQPRTRNVSGELVPTNLLQALIQKSSDEAVSDSGDEEGGTADCLKEPVSQSPAVMQIISGDHGNWAPQSATTTMHENDVNASSGAIGRVSKPRIMEMSPPRDPAAGPQNGMEPRLTASAHPQIDVAVVDSAFVGVVAPEREVTHKIDVDDSFLATEDDLMAVSLPVISRDPSYLIEVSEEVPSPPRQMCGTTKRALAKEPTCLNDSDTVCTPSKVRAITREIVGTTSLGSKGMKQENCHDPATQVTKKDVKHKTTTVKSNDKISGNKKYPCSEDRNEVRVSTKQRSGKMWKEKETPPVVPKPCTPDDATSPAVIEASPENYLECPQNDDSGLIAEHLEGHGAVGPCQADAPKLDSVLQRRLTFLLSAGPVEEAARMDCTDAVTTYTGPRGGVAVSTASAIGLGSRAIVPLVCKPRAVPGISKALRERMAKLAARLLADDSREQNAVVTPRKTVVNQTMKRPLECTKPLTTIIDELFKPFIKVRDTVSRPERICPTAEEVAALDELDRKIRESRERCVIKEQQLKELQLETEKLTIQYDRLTKEAAEVRAEVARKETMDDCPEPVVVDLEEFTVETWTFHKLYLSFNNKTIHLRCKLGALVAGSKRSKSPAQENRKIVSINQLSNFSGTDDSFSKLSHDLMCKVLLAKNLPEICQTTDHLRAALADLGLTSCYFRMLHEDLAAIAKKHLVTVHKQTVNVEFLSLARFLNFTLGFQIDATAYPNTVTVGAPNVIIGKTTEIEVRSVYATVKPGPSFVADVVKAVDVWMYDNGRFKSFLT